MNTFSLLLFFGVYSLGVIGEDQVEIENCNTDYVDIQENKNNTIVCKGFNPNTTIVWEIKRSKQDKTTVATCAPNTICTVHETAQFAAERSGSQSKLFYQQYDRSLDLATELSCKTQGTSNFNSCTLNVINPATLSECSVEEDRDRGTVTGRCRYDHAYSSIRGVTCTWYQIKDGELSETFLVTNGLQIQNGWCNFTGSGLEWTSGTYTYIISFYPGPGSITVRAAGKISTTQQTALTTVSHEDETSSSVAAIVGGSVGGVIVLVAIFAVIAVVMVKRRGETYAKPRPPTNAEHVYADLHTNTTTTTTTTVTPPSDSTATTTSDQHNSGPHKPRNNPSRQNHVYVNENQSGSHSFAVYHNQGIETSKVTPGMQQNPTYVNDLPGTAQACTASDRDSDPYYSEITD